MNENELIRVDQLCKFFNIRDTLLRKRAFSAVENASFSLNRGETLALIGESGSGKSTVGRIILDLLQPSSGGVFYKGEAIRSFRGSKLKEYRKAVQAVFQDPHLSLNPRMTVGETISEPLHNFSFGGDYRARLFELLEQVGLNAKVARHYPHQCSTGQKQRVAIARALAVRPEVIILDEPLSALDITVQTQILSLLKNLRAQFDMSYLLITHDLRVVRAIADRVAVMYRGRIVETADTTEFMANPVHPHAKALLDAVPQLVVYKK